MKFPDFHNGREPTPLTRKEYESWARERVVGRRKFVRGVAIYSGCAFALIGLVVVTSLLLFANRPMPQLWPILIVLPSLGMFAFGFAMGWFVSNVTWLILETRFAATGPEDLDDDNLNAGKIEQDRIAISAIPFVVGLVLVLLLPEKYAVVGFVGIGTTMMWFGWIALSSTVEPTDSSVRTSRPKIWFIFLFGVCCFVVASYLTLVAVLS